MGRWRVATNPQDQLQMIISKGKRQIGQSPREPRCKLPAIVSQWRHIAVLNSPSNYV